MNRSAIQHLAISKTKPEIKNIASNMSAPIDFITIDDLKVKNDNAYKEFLVLKDNEWICDKRYYTSSFDRTLNIDLLVKKTLLKKAIAHLPVKEQQFIRCSKFICEGAYLALSKLKDKALGNTRYQSIFSNQGIDDMLVLENRKADMLSLFGKMWSAEEVLKECIKEWGINVSIYSIERFRTRNLDKILDLQKEYTNNYKDIRLSFKKSRLEEYTWLYQATKEKFEARNSNEDRKFLKELLESIKKEVDGDVIRIEGDLQVNIEHTLNAHVQKEIFSKMLLNEMILTRVAQNSGVNPFLLLYRLQNSYYNKFTGFSKSGAEDTVSLPEYPSSYSYDLDKLSEMHNIKHKADVLKEKTFNSFMEVPKTKKSSAKTIKQIMMERLKQKRDDLEQGIKNVEIKNND